MSLKEQLKQLLKKVASKDVNNYFAQPVKIEEVPLYYEYIKSPMDFATMKQKLNSGAYHSVDDMSKDFDLIWTNCMIFNGDDTLFFKEAQRLKRITKPIVDSYRKKAKTAKSSKSNDLSESSLSTLGSTNRITLKFSSSSNSLASDDGETRSQITSSPRLISASASPSSKVYRFAAIPPPFRSTNSLVNHTQLAEGSIACLAELARLERSLSDITDKKAVNIGSLPPGPMLYNEYRPLAQVPFDSRYVDRVARYSLGPNKKTDQLSNFLYHQKMDNIITDPNSMPVFKSSHDWKPQETFLENVDSFRDHYNPTEPYGMSAKQLISIQNLLQRAATRIKSETSDDTVMKDEHDVQSNNQSNDQSIKQTIKQENIHVKTESDNIVSSRSTGPRLVQVKIAVSPSGSITTTILPANNWSCVTSSAPITVLDNAAAVVRLISNWQKTKHIKPEQPSTPQHNSNQQINPNRTAPVSYPVPASAQHTGSQSFPSTPQSHPSAASSPAGSEKSQAKKERQRARELEKEKEREKLKEKERKKQEKERKRAKRKLEEQQQAAQQKPDLKPIIISQSSPSADNEQAAKRRRLDDGRVSNQPYQQQMHPVVSQYQQRSNMPGPTNTINTMQMHPQQYVQHQAPMGVQQATASATNAVSNEVRLAYTIYANSVKNGKPMTGMQITDALMREGKNIPLRDAQIAVAQLTAILQQREKTRLALAQQSAAQPQQQVQSTLQQVQPSQQVQSHQQVQSTHQQVQPHQQIQPHQQVQSSHQPSQSVHQQVQTTHQQVQSTHQVQPIHVQQPHSQPIVVQSAHSQPVSMHSNQMQGALQAQAHQPAHHQHSSQHEGQTMHPQAFQLMQGQSVANPMPTSSSPPAAAMQTNDPQQTFRNNLSRLAQQAKSLLPDSIANSYITSLNELKELSDVNHHQMLLQTKYNQLKHLVNQAAAARQAGQQPAPIQQTQAHPVHQQQSQQQR